eukprot:563284-Pleurochrysis_carterae.AAC.2
MSLLHRCACLGLLACLFVHARERSCKRHGKIDYWQPRRYASIGVPFAAPTADACLPPGTAGVFHAPSLSRCRTSCRSGSHRGRDSFRWSTPITRCAMAAARKTQGVEGRGGRDACWATGRYSLFD